MSTTDRDTAAVAAWNRFTELKRTNHHAAMVFLNENPDTFRGREVLAANAAADTAKATHEAEIEAAVTARLAKATPNPQTPPAPATPPSAA